MNGFATVRFANTGGRSYPHTPPVCAQSVKKMISRYWNSTPTARIALKSILRYVLERLDALRYEYMVFTLKGAMGVLGGGYEQIKRITQRKKSQAKRISRDCWSISDDYITLGKGRA